MWNYWASAQCYTGRVIDKVFALRPPRIQAGLLRFQWQIGRSKLQQVTVPFWTLHLHCIMAQWNVKYLDNITRSTQGISFFITAKIVLLNLQNNFSLQILAIAINMKFYIFKFIFLCTKKSLEDEVKVTVASWIREKSK